MNFNVLGTADNLEMETIIPPACKIIQNHSESLSQLILSVEIVHLLYTEEVISEETCDEIKKLGGCLAGGPLTKLSSTVSENPKKLNLFATVLLQSEDTVCVGKDILKEYGKLFLLYV